MPPEYYSRGYLPEGDIYWVGWLVKTWMLSNGRDLPEKGVIDDWYRKLMTENSSQRPSAVALLEDSSGWLAASAQLGRP